MPFSKRILDIVLGTLLILLTSPLWLIITLLIILFDRGPIFVRLERVSEGRHIFIYKFRSMIPGAHEKKGALSHLNERTDGPFFKIRHDPRVTPVGRLIRRFRFDELPQLFNVVRGELSLVGPRPHEPTEVALYPAEFQNLPKVRAGLTGLSQVRGASSLPFLRELELDTWYINQWSLWLDMKILMRTVAIFLFDHTAV